MINSQDRCIVVHHGRLLCRAGETTRFVSQQLIEVGLSSESINQYAQMLASEAGGNLYLVPLIDIEPELEAIILDPASAWNWADLREFLAQYDASEFLIHARAVQYFHWLREHRYCGICGGGTVMAVKENALECSACEKFWFPRIQPCIITLIHKGEYVLLAKHSRYASDYYSCIAGFAESGESLEQTLHREVKEEVGLEVTNLRYFGSQAWPFPYQLMVGFYAEYARGDIVVDLDEIVEANWWHIKDLPNHPPTTSISGQLIAQYIANFSG